MKKGYKLHPPLKWAGGKRWLLPQMKSIWPNFERKQFRFVEPFCGGISISLGLLPQKALLNDINQPLINYYQWVKKGLYCEEKKINDKDFFYKKREEFNYLISNSHKNEKRAAEIFYYLNKTCYNGLCRFNSRGEFNVPFGKYQTINYQNDFLEFVEIFKDWKFSNKSFDQLHYDSKDFIFADPPYDVEFRQYSKYGFNWDQQIKLIDQLSKIENPIILLNQATTRIIELYKYYNFRLYKIESPIRINRKRSQKKATLIFACKNLLTYPESLEKIL